MLTMGRRVELVGMQSKYGELLRLVPAAGK